jgi:trigger factor
MKGFRPGRVPESLVEKLYGKALAYGIADEHVQKAYRDEVLEGSDYDVMGSPTITELRYEYGADLAATVRFGVRPEIELADLSDVLVSRLVHTVTDEEVDEELTGILEREAELTPVEGPAEADSLVTVDLQRVDPETGSPIVGEKREDVSFFVSNEELPEATRRALVGVPAGQTVRIALVQTGNGEEALFDATVKEVKRRDLPTLDDAFVSALTNGDITDVESFRVDLRTRMQRSVDRTARELFEGDLVRAVLDRHDFDVPSSVVDMVLDGRFEDFKRQLGDRMPENFDEEGFREAARPEATRQARWMLIRDHVARREGLEVTDEDRDAYFAEMAAGQGMPADFLARYYRSMPKLMQQLDERLYTGKVLDWLAGLVGVEEKDRGSWAEGRDEHAHHDHDHDHDHHHHHHDHDHDHDH